MHLFLCTAITLKAECIAHEDGTETEQQHTAVTGNVLTGSATHQHTTGNQQHHNRCKQIERELTRQHLAVEHHRRNHCRNTQNEHTIEDVTAKHITQRDTGITAQRRTDTDNKLRQRGSDSNDCKTDHKFAHLKASRQSRRAIGKPIGTEDDQQNAGNETQYGKYHKFIFTF